MPAKQKHQHASLPHMTAFLFARLEAPPLRRHFRGVIKLPLLVLLLITTQCFAKVKSMTRTTKKQKSFIDSLQSTPPPLSRSRAGGGEEGMGHLNGPSQRLAFPVLCCLLQTRADAESGSSSGSPNELRNGTAVLLVYPPALHPRLVSHPHLPHAPGSPHMYSPSLRGVGSVLAASSEAG